MRLLTNDFRRKNILQAIVAGVKQNNNHIINITHLDQQEHTLPLLVSATWLPEVAFETDLDCELEFELLYCCIAKLQLHMYTHLLPEVAFEADLDFEVEFELL